MPGDHATRAHGRASAVWAVDRAISVVTTAYRAGGGSSVYSDCPLQRRLRDIYATSVADEEAAASGQQASGAEDICDGDLEILDLVVGHIEVRQEEAA